VLSQQGKDAEALIEESIRILEESGLGESPICIQRMRYLSTELIKSNRLAEAENWQRKILHNLELSKACRYIFLLLYYCFIICSGDSTAYANLVIVMMHALKNELELIYVFRY
jgi:hypothetical protein